MSSLRLALKQSLAETGHLAISNHRTEEEDSGSTKTEDRKKAKKKKSWRETNKDSRHKRHRKSLSRAKSESNNRLNSSSKNNNNNNDSSNNNNRCVDASKKKTAYPLEKRKRVKKLHEREKKRLDSRLRLPRGKERRRHSSSSTFSLSSSLSSSSNSSAFGGECDEKELFSSSSDSDNSTTSTTSKSDLVERTMFDSSTSEEEKEFGRNNENHGINDTDDDDTSIEKTKEPKKTSRKFILLKKKRLGKKKYIISNGGSKSSNKKMDESQNNSDLMSSSVVDSTDEQPTIKTKSKSFDKEEMGSFCGSIDVSSTENRHSMKKSVSTRKSLTQTVMGPSQDIIHCMESLSCSEQRNNIRAGQRVKVRFEPKKKKHKLHRRDTRWYGGCVSEVYNGGKRIRIHYDDGTSEVSDFPDRDIFVDDTENGKHKVSVGIFLPQHLRPLSDEGDKDNKNSKNEQSHEMIHQQQHHHNTTNEKKRKDVSGEKSSKPPKPLNIFFKEQEEMREHTQKSNEFSCDPIKVPNSNGNDVVKDMPEQMSDRIGSLSSPAPSKSFTVTESTYSVCSSNNNNSNEYTESSCSVASYDVGASMKQRKIDGSNENSLKIGFDSDSNNNRMIDVVSSVEKERLVPRLKLSSSSVSRGGKVDRNGSFVEDVTFRLHNSGDSCVADFSPTCPKEQSPQHISSNLASSPITLMTARAGNISGNNDKNIDPTDQQKDKKNEFVENATDNGSETQEENDDESQRVDNSNGFPKKNAPRSHEGAATVNSSNNTKHSSRNSFTSTNVESKSSAGYVEQRKLESKTSDNDIFSSPLHASARENCSSAQEYKERKSKKINTRMVSTTGEHIVSPLHEESHVACAPEKLVTNETYDQTELLDGKDKDAKRNLSIKISMKPKQSDIVLKSETSEIDRSDNTFDSNNATPFETSHGDVVCGEIDENVYKERTESLIKRVDSNISSQFSSEHGSITSENDRVPTKSMSRDGDEISNTSNRNLNTAPSRSSRLAAQKAKERIVSKQEVIVEEFGFPKKKKDRLDNKKHVSSLTLDEDGIKIKHSTSEEVLEEVGDSEDVWVQCDRCLKWRRLPRTVQTDDLPETWFCEMNKYDLKRNHCDAPEQTIEEFAIERNSSQPESSKTKKQNSIETSTDDQHQSRKRSLPLPDNRNAKKSNVLSDEGERAKNIELSISRDSLNDPDRIVSNDNAHVSPTNTTNQNDEEDADYVNSGSESCDNLNSMDKKDYAYDSRGFRGSSKPRNRIRFNKEISEKSLKSSKSGKSQQTKEKAESQEWVQCEKCEKWRKLPPRISSKDLPDTWYCSMNTWDLNSASCDVAEDDFDMSNNGGGRKPCFRTLIFGSGKKNIRPTTERARAADSVFVSHSRNDQIVENGAQQHPTFAYAQSSAYIQKSSHLTTNSALDQGENNKRSFLSIMKYSDLWKELSGSEFSSTACVSNYLKEYLKHEAFLALEDKAVSTHDIVVSIRWKLISSSNDADKNAIDHFVSCENIMFVLNELINEEKVSVSHENALTVDINALVFRRINAVNPKKPRLIKISKPWKNGGML